MVTKKTDKLEIGPGQVAMSHTMAPVRYTPDELKTLMEAINLAPGWMSKRFIMQELCGWSEARIKLNAQLKTEEDNQSNVGNRVGGFR
jgi:hypothetical protein